MSRKSIKQMFTHPTPGGPASGGVGGSTFQKCGKLHELPRKSINKKNSTEKITKTCNSHPTPSDGGGGGLGAKISK